LLSAYGWPGSNGQDIISQPNPYSKETCGIANPQNQIAVNQRLLNQCGSQKVACALYTAFSEPYLASGDASSFANYWGMCSGFDPSNCTNIVGPAGTAVGPFSSVAVAPVAGSNLGLILGVTLGCVAAAILLAIILIVIVLLLIRKRRKDRIDEYCKIILNELQQDEPNFAKIVNIVREHGVHLQNLMRILLVTLEISPVARDLSSYLCLVDILAMYTLILNHTKMDSRTKNRINEGSDHLSQYIITNATSQFHRDCAFQFLHMILEMDQYRVDVEQVVAAAHSTMTVQQCNEVIKQEWMYRVMLLRLIAYQAKHDPANLQRVVGYANVKEEDWHVVYDHVLTLMDVAMSVPDTSIDFTETARAFGNLFSEFASYESLSVEQNKWVRVLTLYAMQEIILSSTTTTLIKMEAVMTLISRKLLETEPEIVEIVDSITKNSDLDSWKSQIEDNWHIVISLLDEKWEEQVECNRRLNSLNKELEAWESEVHSTQMLLNSITRNNNGDVEKTKRQEQLLMEKMKQTKEQVERMKKEISEAELKVQDATTEFFSVKNNFEQLQSQYTVPQVQVLSKGTGGPTTTSDRRRSLDAISSERLWTAVEETYYEEVPTSLKCPLTNTIFVDPVIVVATGQTYERGAIDKWFVTHDDDPVTHDYVVNKNIVPNNAMKMMVSEWVNAHYDVNV
jgi:hypothetical protein